MRRSNSRDFFTLSLSVFGTAHTWASMVHFFSRVMNETAPPIINDLALAAGEVNSRIFSTIPNLFGIELPAILFDAWACSFIVRWVDYKAQGKDVFWFLPLPEGKKLSGVDYLWAAFLPLLSALWYALPALFFISFWMYAKRLVQLVGEVVRYFDYKPKPIEIESGGPAADAIGSTVARSKFMPIGKLIFLTLGKGLRIDLQSRAEQINQGRSKAAAGMLLRCAIFTCIVLAAYLVLVVDNLSQL